LGVLAAAAFELAKFSKTSKQKEKIEERISRRRSRR